jgi:hypothetical protein
MLACNLQTEKIHGRSHSHSQGSPNKRSIMLRKRTVDTWQLPDADGGFHWTKTDTIITICVCLGFGMIVKTVCLILYMRRKYLGKGRGKARPLIGGSFSSSPAGSAPIPGDYDFPVCLEYTWQMEWDWQRRGSPSSRLQICLQFSSF